MRPAPTPRRTPARTGSEHDADDVCQDSFLRVLERIEGCRRPERFRAWPLAIVRSRAADLTERRPAPPAGGEPGG